MGSSRNPLIRLLVDYTKLRISNLSLASERVHCNTFEIIVSRGDRIYPLSQVEQIPVEDYYNVRKSDLWKFLI